ncbi:Ribosome association toxin PasT (RatA) of the RatAB toxin-antitoxin module [Oceanospirillum multiglobuliferum]|uniref:Ubiquinone-binding protein n=1 Tax=Oceanospirillum multiglobuliferum TaxID=64969 RepID=A0A1T4RGM1_9GAMM|nr:type II toxin-antitoxin system RatA family toxin [Oceanospirillum multiglobuliferum]OPX54874.1 ubiquinone-binding protein [Oceanospirillum multiglobuliferum]SKA15037.1 Ribosome association toxin PasT (RatA) of the RatAB toxin-antitoxin module [Oceanospirillum multiglobuliferum]
MTTVTRTALVMHSAKQMYDLVNDCESYPQFLPWCSGATLIESSATHMVGRLEIAKAGLKHSFTTRNTLQEPNRIELKLVDGPFKKLEGEWRFDALSDEACKVSLTMEFEFSSKVLSMALGGVFNQAANTLVDAFCQRANEVYGR